MRRCAGLNNCAFGCPTGAKQSMLVVASSAKPPLEDGATRPNQAKIAGTVAPELKPSAVHAAIRSRGYVDPDLQRDVIGGSPPLTQEVATHSGLVMNDTVTVGEAAAPAAPPPPTPAPTRPAPPGLR